MAESRTSVTDRVEAALIECGVEPVDVCAPVVPRPPDQSPAERAAAATIEQTGAGPPPKD